MTAIDINGTFYEENTRWLASIAILVTLCKYIGRILYRYRSAALWLLIDVI